MDGTSSPASDPAVAVTAECVGGDAMLSLKETWNALACAMRYPTVFCTWEWTFAWWKHFCAGRNLRLMLLRRHGHVVGILPLYSERRVISLDGRVGRVVSYCGAADLFPDPLDIISAPADARACARAALDHWRSNASGWDVLHLRFLVEDSALMRCAADGAHGDVQATQVVRAPFISITGSYEDFVRTLSSNERSKVGRSRRKLIEQKGVEYVDLGAEGTDQALLALLALHEKRAGAKKMQSTFARANVVAFHRDFLGRIDPRYVWLRGLRLHGELLAAFYGFAMGGRVAYYQLGHDPAWSTFSPGTVLLQETIREAFARGFTEYNFLQGEEAFKFRWTSQIRWLQAVDIFNQSPLGRVSRWVVSARRRLKSVALALAHR